MEAGSGLVARRGPSPTGGRGAGHEVAIAPQIQIQHSNFTVAPENGKKKKEAAFEGGRKRHRGLKAQCDIRTKREHYHDNPLLL